MSAPLRAVSRLRGTSGPVRASAFVDPATDEQILRDAIDAVLRSRSWRSTRWLRRAAASEPQHHDGPPLDRPG